MAELGFIGLGIMGYPMARNLCRAGHRVRVWSHTAAKAVKLAAEHGAVVCSNPREIAVDADCVFVCVGNSDMSRDVILGRSGLIQGALPGLVTVDASTVSAAASTATGEALAARGIHFLDAPCTGSKLGAEGGALTFMIGGDSAVFERVKPYFEPMGKTFFYCGAQGMGIRVKLAQNLIQANILQSFIEGIVLGAKAGVDPNLMLEVLNGTAAKAGLVAFKAPYIFRRDFDTHFALKWMDKDIGLALELAESEKVPLPITSITRQLFQAAIAQGLGEDDFCSVIKVLEGMAGVEVKAN